MKKITLLLITTCLGFQNLIFSQSKESIVSELNNFNPTSTSLKEFSIESGPNEEVKFSLILTKETKYELAVYQNEPNQYNIELYKEIPGDNLLVTKSENKNISSGIFECKQTAVYQLIVKNTSSKKSKSALLLSFFETSDKTPGEDVAKTSSKSDKNSINADEKSDGGKILIEENIYLSVETMPKFKGQGNQGDSHNNFREYIQKNLIYPEEAKAKKLQGKVYVSFVVDKEGYIKDAKVVRGSHASLNQESLRVVLSSPRWEPGKDKGKPVSVSFTMPIIFSLNEEKVE